MVFKHAESQDYNFAAFISDPSYVGNVIDFDRPRLGDVTGLNCVHLQCHIGTDTLGLARLGAASVTGLDISDASIKEARRLAEATNGTGGEKVKYVEASVYGALDVLPEGQFDLVFTGVGAICWIHSIQMWAEVVSKLLKPGGRLFIRECHPIMWAIDEDVRDKLVVRHPYFELPDPINFEDSGTYTDGDHTFQATQSAEFNHGIAEIIQALLDHGMTITAMEEHQSLPWLALPEQMTADSRGRLTLQTP